MYSNTTIRFVNTVFQDFKDAYRYDDITRPSFRVNSMLRLYRINYGEIHNCTFTKNSGVYLISLGNKVFKISACNFNANKFSRRIIVFELPVNLYIDNCTFANNNAHTLFNRYTRPIIEGGYLEMTSCIIIYNTCILLGFVMDYDFHISNTTITNNTVQRGFMSSNSLFEINNIRVADNDELVEVVMISHSPGMS